MTENVKKILVGSAAYLDEELKRLIEAAQAARKKLKEDSDTLISENLDHVDDEAAMQLHHTYSRVADRCRSTTNFIRRRTDEADN